MSCNHIGPITWSARSGTYSVDLTQPERYLSTYDLIELMVKLSPKTISLSVQNWSRENFHGRTILSCLKKLKESIVMLDFRYANLKDDEVIAIVDFYSSSLRRLLLKCCTWLTQSAWSTIPKCSELQCLSLCGVLDISDHHVKEIVLHCTKLEDLDLRYCSGITVAGLMDLHRLQYLRHLGLPENVSSREISSILGKILTLQYLELHMIDCDIAFFREIATLRNLRTLKLPRRSDRAITPGILDVICKNFRKLRRLEVQFVAEFTNADAVKLNLLKELKYLYIGGGAELTDLTSDGDVSTSALRTLVVASRPVTEMALVKYAARHSNMENLFIFGYPTLTDDDFISILDREPHLRRLGMTDGLQLTNRSIRALVHLCPQLQWVSVQRCPGMTARGWSYFRERRPSVVCSFRNNFAVSDFLGYLEPCFLSRE